MSQAFAHRNLLFGVLAWKLDFIRTEQLLAGMSAWAADKARSLGEILVEQGALRPEQREPLESLVDLHIQAHEYNAQTSLVAVGPLGALGEQLQRLGDQQLTAILSNDAAPAAQAAGDAPTVSLGGAAETATLSETPHVGDQARPEERSPSVHQTTTHSRPRYRLTRLHATGGIGRVWLAHDPELGRDVALKELRPERANHAAACARFLEEAQITGQLEHPGIVPVYDLVRHSPEQPWFYTMRFLKGRTLSEAIAAYHEKRGAGQSRPLDLRELLGAFVAVCNAVAYCAYRSSFRRTGNAISLPNVYAVL